MDDFHRSIAESVKTGQYYTEARKWYLNRFVFVSSERAYIIAMMSLFVTAIVIMAFYYQLTDPAPPEVTYISPAEDVAKTYSMIHNAGFTEDNPQTQITKYMLSTYVIRRERYFFDRQEGQLIFVRNNTVGTEYLKYENARSMNNPSSPVMLYQENNVINIDVHKVSLLPSKGANQYAVVYFQSALKNILSNQVTLDDFVASISYKIDNVEALINDRSKQLKFLVLDYKLHKLDRGDKK